MYEIKQASPADAPELQILLRQLGYDSAEQDIAKALASPKEGTDVYAAFAGSRLVGFISLIYYFYFPLQQQVCRITTLVVQEDLQGNGVGSCLISFAKKKAAEHSCVLLEVTTSISRKKAQKYYEALGFKKASYRYYQELAG